MILKCAMDMGPVRLNYENRFAKLLPGWKCDPAVLVRHRERGVLRVASGRTTTWVIDSEVILARAQTAGRSRSMTFRRPGLVVCSCFWSGTRAFSARQRAGKRRAPNGKNP